MSQMSTLTKFNNTVEQLIDSLIERYDYNESFKRELTITREKFVLLRKTNPRKVIEGILVFVYPYKKQIMDNDVDFFVKKNYSEDTNDEGHLVQALKLKELWETDMDEMTQTTIFNFFKVFIVLAERYVAERMESEKSN
jgi:hypothetical protein